MASEVQRGATNKPSQQLNILRKIYISTEKLNDRYNEKRTFPKGKVFYVGMLS